MNKMKDPLLVLHAKIDKKIIQSNFIFLSILICDIIITNIVIFLKIDYYYILLITILSTIAIYIFSRHLIFKNIERNDFKIHLSGKNIVDLKEHKYIYNEELESLLEEIHKNGPIISFSKFQKIFEKSIANTETHAYDDDYPYEHYLIYGQTCTQANVLKNSPTFYEISKYVKFPNK